MKIFNFDDVDFDDVEHSAKELERIEKLRKEGKPIDLNRKGRLCFRQMHPDFPIYLQSVAVTISAIATLITIISLLLHT